MSTSTMLRILAIGAIIASFAVSTSAMADHQTKLVGFTWLDETVYRPSPSNERDRAAGHFGGICYEKNCR
jgi:hypothetical protein